MPSSSRNNPYERRGGSGLPDYSIGYYQGEDQRFTNEQDYPQHSSPPLNPFSSPLSTSEPLSQTRRSPVQRSRPRPSAINIPSPETPSYLSYSPYLNQNTPSPREQSDREDSILEGYVGSKSNSSRELMGGMDQNDGEDVSSLPSRQRSAVSGAISHLPSDCSPQLPYSSRFEQSPLPSPTLTLTPPAEDEDYYNSNNRSYASNTAEDEYIHNSSYSDSHSPPKSYNPLSEMRYGQSNKSSQDSSAHSAPPLHYANSPAHRSPFNDSHDQYTVSPAISSATPQQQHDSRHAYPTYTPEPASYPSTQWRGFQSSSVDPSPGSEKASFNFPITSELPMPPSSRKQSIFKKKWFWILLGVAVIAGGGGAAAGLVLSKKNSERSSASSTVDEGSLSGATSVAGVKASGTSSAQPVSTGASSTARRLVVFGASYCDNGHPRPSEYSATLRSPPYFEGRDSNGIVWDEYLATTLGSADMRNYAYTGAMVNNSITFAAVPDLKAQIASYLADIKSGLIPTLPAGGKTLIAIWVGLNSVMGTYVSLGVSNPPTAKQQATALSTMSETSTSLITQIASFQSSLSSVFPSTQAFDFLVLPLPPTQILPWAVHTASANNQGGLNLLKNMTEVYNAGIMGGLPKLLATRGAGSVITYDMTTLYTNWMANPSSAGVTNVTAACLVGTVACLNPQAHFWWDSIHMTTAIHSLVSQALVPSILALWK